MDPDEVALVLAGKGHARCAVRLVADDQVELGQAEPLLGGGDGLGGLIGGEHHRHALRVRRGRLGSELCAVRGGWDLQVVNVDVGEVVGPAPAHADLGVRAHREGAQRHLAVDRPLAHGLLHQREGRDQKEHAPALPREILGNSQSRERLAGAAGHDEFAAVGLGEAVAHALDRLALVLARLFLLVQTDLAGIGERAPVDPAILKVCEADAEGFHLLVAQRGFRIVRPVGSRGVHEDAADKGDAARSGEEAVDVLAPDTIALL